MSALLRGLAPGLAAALLCACDNSPWEPGADSRNTLYSAMVDVTPRHLDPTAAYWENDAAFTYQIYEPLYGFHYLKRPYELVPRAAREVVRPAYLDKDGRRLPDDAPAGLVAESVYDIPIKPGILYQPHPCFAADAHGHPLYLSMKAGELGGRGSPLEFGHQGTREVVAEDFVYALKRHASPRIAAPAFGTFAQYVAGLAQYADLLRAEDAKLRRGLDPAAADLPFLDLRKYPLAGASAPDRHTFRVRLKGKYLQWDYWMTMPFLAPVPWEADAFYAQPGMARASLSMDTWPVGSGPYMQTERVKDRRQVMARNPNYRREPYPCEGGPGDRQAGLLDDCGKPTPFIDEIVMTVEHEGIARKAKFVQGHYDIEVFERANTGQEYIAAMQDSGDVRKLYEERRFRLDRQGDVASYYLGFNMLDPVVGLGDAPQRRARNRKLRQAVSIAVDWEEYSRIFPNHAGATAMGPVPPGISGSREDTPEGVDPVTHRLVDGRAVRRPIEDARRLLAEAGYPGGRDERTGRPLVLSYDYAAPPTPERKVELDWMTRQFAKLGIQLEVRATDNNQFQDRLRKGRQQVFWYGWNADYPDAENFLMLFYGPNGKAASDGENVTNYVDPEYDRLFERMKMLEDGPARQALIDTLVRKLQQDAPVCFGFYPDASAAAQHWVYNGKMSVVVKDRARYLRLDAAERHAALARWNRPVWWPLAALPLAAAGLLWPAARALRRRERLNARGEPAGAR